MYNQEKCALTTDSKNDYLNKGIRIRLTVIRDSLNAPFCILHRTNLLT